MNRKAKDEAAKRVLKRRCKVLLDGISEAAMREIELLGHYDMPVFQFRDEATLLKLRAMAREDSNP